MGFLSFPNDDSHFLLPKNGAVAQKNQNNASHEIHLEVLQHVQQTLKTINTVASSNIGLEKTLTWFKALLLSSAFDFVTTQTH